jgi:ATP-dependent DNA helicase RecG
VRPFILDPLFVSVQRVHGIGPRFAKVLEKLAGPCVLDLLFHWPVAAVDRRQIKKIEDLQAGTVATIIGKVTSTTFAQYPGRPSKVTISDDTGHVTLTFFKNPGGYLQKNYPLGKEVAISGRVETYQGMPQLSHPDKVTDAANVNSIALMEPIYPLTLGITNAVLTKAEQACLNKIPKLPEWLDTEFVTQEKWPQWHEALEQIHRLTEIEALSPQFPARRRCAYDEVLAHQLALALIRQQQKKSAHAPIVADIAKMDHAIRSLPFTLTSGQQHVLGEITHDLQQNFQMCRLLQGDVGSGKTVLAFLAAIHVISAGFQAVIMAPTEILARQHLHSLQPLADANNIKMALLTAREKGKAREKILADLAAGTIDFLIGTHAVIQDPVHFKNLGLAIIDEQHRFGVSQRLALSEKGNAVNLLVMTATPIPRTLSLTTYGDMENSILREKPPGRKPIDTRVMSHDKIPDIVSGLKNKIAQGDRIYWVCPLVEESELIDLSAAEDRHAALIQHFPGRVGLIHGRLKGDEKDAVMAQFIAGDLDILVATTVIEVGVNVPEATVMIIEHSERFGLSQLHQLRGRVGRGDKAGTCLLLYEAPLGKIAKQRLEALRQSEDGFEIAEMDLTLRGPGDILGTKQSGDVAFRLADLTAHQDLLHAAHQEAKLILQKDPDLTTERGKGLRLLLYLFERDQADKFLAAG